MDNSLIDLEAIGDQSVAKGILDLEGLFPDVMSEEDLTRKTRLFSRMSRVGKAASQSFYYRSLLAEELWWIKKEEDWKLVIHNRVDKGSGEILSSTCSSWGEFREILASVFPISTGSIGYYLKLMALYTEGLRKDPSTFADTGGIITMGHIEQMTAGHDMRTIEDGELHRHLRPRTQEFADHLEKEYPGMGYPEQLSLYYDTIAHDYADPSAINKTAKELAAQAKERTGAPDIWAKDANQNLYRFKVIMKFPDQEAEDGSVIMGEEGEFFIRFEGGDVPTSVRSWVAKRLGVKDY